MPKQRLWICRHALTHTCTHASMHVCSLWKAFFMQFVKGILKTQLHSWSWLRTLTETLHQVPTWGPEQVYMYSLNPKVSGLDRMVVSAARTTESISVWKKWSIPTPDVTGSAEPGLCGSTTLVIYLFTHGNAMRSVCERERERRVLAKLAVSKAVNEIRAFIFFFHSWAGQKTCWHQK